MRCSILNTYIYYNKPVPSRTATSKDNTIHRWNCFYCSLQPTGLQH